MQKLRILIVEDDNAKYDDVLKKLKKRFRSEKLAVPTVSRESNFADAAEAVREHQYDLIVLDLKLPFVDGGEPSFEASTNLASYLLKSRVNRPFRIIALTAHTPDDYESFNNIDPTLVVEHYSANTDGWLNRIVNETHYLFAAKRSLVQYFSQSYDLDVLFIVARHDNEYVPVCEAIEWIGDTSEDAAIENRANRFGRIKISRGHVVNGGIVCLQEVGLSTSAALTAYLVATYRPKFLFMLGMCCGLNDDRSPSKSLLGDVIVADETGCWDEGKYSDELTKNDPFYVRSVSRTPAPSFRANISRYIETKYGELRTEINKCSKSFNLDEVEKGCGEQINRNPDIHLGLVLSGSSVVDSVSQIGTIRERFPKAIGLEMEAHSIYAAMDATPGARPNALVIKGVADHGQGKKNKAAQPWASASSYAVAKKILEWQGVKTSG